MQFWTECSLSKTNAAGFRNASPCFLHEEPTYSTVKYTNVQHERSVGLQNALSTQKWRSKSRKQAGRRAVGMQDCTRSAARSPRKVGHQDNCQLFWLSLLTLKAAAAPKKGGKLPVKSEVAADEDDEADGVLSEEDESSGDDNPTSDFQG